MFERDLKKQPAGKVSFLQRICTHKQQFTARYHKWKGITLKTSGIVNQEDLKVMKQVFGFLQLSRQSYRSK